MIIFIYIKFKIGKNQIIFPLIRKAFKNQGKDHDKSQNGDELQRQSDVTVFTYVFIS